MEHAAGPLVEAFDIRPADVGEAQPPAWIRQADLTGMEMTGEDEIEYARLEPVDHLRKVAEQDAEVGFRVGEPLGPSPTRAVRARVDADDMHLPSAQLDCLRLVGEQPRRAQILELNRLRERILRNGVVMVPEHRVAVGQADEKLAETRLAASPRNEIAADQRQIRLPRLDPFHCAPHRVRPARRQPEVEVGEVGDPEPVELGRQAPKRDLDRVQPDPARLEPRVRSAGRGSRADQYRRRETQTSSFSSAGATGTT